MPRPPRGKVADLLAARHTGNHHGGVLSSRLDSGKETQGSHSPRNLVMLLLEAERTGHSTTTGIHELHVIPGHELQSVESRFASCQSLLVAMGDRKSVV